MIQVTVFQKKLAGQVGIQIYVVVKPSSDTFLLFFYEFFFPQFSPFYVLICTAQQLTSSVYNTVPQF